MVVRDAVGIREQSTLWFLRRDLGKSQWAFSKQICSLVHAQPAGVHEGSFVVADVTSLNLPGHMSGSKKKKNPHNLASLKSGIPGLESSFPLEFFRPLESYGRW